MNVTYPPGVDRRYDPYYPIGLTVWFFAEASFPAPHDPDQPIVIMMPATISFWVSVAGIS